MKINVREYRRGKQKQKIQRNWQHRIHKTQDKNKRQRLPKGQLKIETPRLQRNWQHRVHKTQDENKRQRIPKGQAIIDNPAKLATQGTQDQEYIYKKEDK